MFLGRIEIQQSSKEEHRGRTYRGSIESCNPKLVSENSRSVASNYTIIDNGTYVIANGTYMLNKTIIVVEFARLIVENATVTFNTTDCVVVRSYDNAIVNTTNSEIRHAQGSQLHCEFSSSVTVTNSTVDILISYHSADVSITKSTLDIVHGYGSSVVSISDTEIRFVGGHDTSSVFVADSMVNKVYGSDHAIVSVDNSTVDSLADVYRFSTVSLVNSTINQACVYGLSVVLIANCTVCMVGGSGSSGFSVVDSTIGLLSCWRTSVFNSVISEVELRFYYGSIVLVSLPKGFVDYWSHGDLIMQDSQVSDWAITGYSISIVKVVNSTISTVTSYLSSAISITDSMVNNVIAYESSVVKLVNSTVCGNIDVLGHAKVYVSWYLDVLVVDDKESPLPSVHVTVYLGNGTLLAETTTNGEGSARFILCGKMINTTGTFPCGNYIISTFYAGYKHQRTIEAICGNMAITGVIPLVCIYHRGLICGICTEWMVLVLPGNHPIRIIIRQIK
jgi:hypothetical protein